MALYLDAYSAFWGMRTFTPKAEDVEHRWWLVDAENKPLGRLATEIARVLRGKH